MKVTNADLWTMTIPQLNAEMDRLVPIMHQLEKQFHDHSERLAGYTDPCCSCDGTGCSHCAGGKISQPKRRRYECQHVRHLIELADSQGVSLAELAQQPRNSGWGYPQADSP